MRITIAILIICILVLIGYSYYTTSVIQTISNNNVISNSITDKGNTVVKDNITNSIGIIKEQYKSHEINTVINPTPLVQSPIVEPYYDPNVKSSSNITRSRK